MGSRKKGRLEKQKPCQDCRTLIGAGDQRPAILPWFLDVGWRPSFRGHTGTLPVAPSRRIAAGLSVGTNANTEPRFSLFMPPGCEASLEHDPEKREAVFRKDHAQTTIQSAFLVALWTRTGRPREPRSKTLNKRFRSKSRAKTRANGARKNS